MNNEWKELLERIAKGLGAEFAVCNYDWLAVSIGDREFGFHGTPKGDDLAELHELEALAIDQIGENAFKMAIADYFEIGGGAELPEIDIVDIYRADEITRARILARMFEVKNAK